MGTGKKITINKVDKNGGYVPTGASGALNPTYATALSLAADGILTLKAPNNIHDIRGVLGAGPWSAVIAGVLGADEANINGARTLTREGDATVTIGVDTSLMTFTALDGTQTVTIVNWADGDSSVPTSTIYDYQTA